MTTSKLLLRQREAAGPRLGEERLDQRVELRRVGILQPENLHHHRRPVAAAGAVPPPGTRAACWSGTTRFQPGWPASTIASPFIRRAAVEQAGTALRGSLAGALIVSR